MGHAAASALGPAPDAPAERWTRRTGTLDSRVGPAAVNAEHGVAGRLAGERARWCGRRRRGKCAGERRPWPRATSAAWAPTSTITRSRRRSRGRRCRAAGAHPARRRTPTRAAAPSRAAEGRRPGAFGQVALDHGVQGDLRQRAAGRAQQGRHRGRVIRAGIAVPAAVAAMRGGQHEGVGVVERCRAPRASPTNDPIPPPPDQADQRELPVARSRSAP